MRVLLGILVCVAFAIFLCDIAAFWVYRYSGDLPDINALARYAPKQESSVSDACLGEVVVAVPYNALGSNLPAALNVTEVPGHAPFSSRISLMMFCAPSRTLERELKEARLAAQLEQQFSHADLLTIYANRVSFGQNINGVKAASEYYFAKEPGNLDIAESALLAGLLQSPSRYSPLTHPDRALQRRNEVIDAMVAGHSISIDDARAAKRELLSVVTK